MKRTTIRLDNTIRNHIKNGINIIKLYPNNTGYEIIQKISFSIIGDTF